MTWFFLQERPANTGGTLYRYPGFNTQLDFAQLHNDLRWNVQRPQGLEAVMRVRASNGLGVADYGGFYCKRTPTDVDLPALDCRQGDRVQHALRGTVERRGRGVRAVRAAVHHGAGGTAHTRAHDGDADHERAGQRVSSRGSGGADVRHDPEGLGEASGRFREHPERQGPDHNHHGQHVVRVPKFASNNSTGQLILPEGLKVLPLYCLGLHKSPGMRADAHADDPRGVAPQRPLRPRQDVRAVRVPEKLPGASAGGRMRRRGHGVSAAPPVTWLSAEKLEQDGIYVLEDAREMLVWVGRQVPDAVLRETFGVDHVDHIEQRRGAEAVGHAEE